MTNLTSVVQQLKQERDRLGKQIQAIGAALAAFGAAYKGKSGRRTLSAAAREKIAAAQRARWAKVKGDKGQKRNVVTTQKKGVLSDAARKKIAAAQRARWAKVKAAK
jgi:hypothetical protein